MEFYQFMLKRYQDSYQQLKCIIRFVMMMLPVLGFAILIRHVSSVIFHTMLIFTGWCTWTFIEYILHRFWMHDKNSGSAMAQTHHYHHTHPGEMVVTNLHRAGITIILVILVFIAKYLNNYFTLVVGFCFGVAGYFFMHKLLHLRIGQRVFKKLVRYHIYHHCKYSNTCFGISVPWWDDLFKTIPAAPKITQRIIDFYFSDQHEPKQHSLLNYATPRDKVHCKGSYCKRNCATCAMSFKRVHIQ